MSPLSLVLRAHAFVYERSGGLIGHRILGVPTLMLRSTGRRSGTTRTNSLVYAKDAGRCIVVPSNGGADAAPGWLFNVRERPDVEVQIARKSWSARAEVIDSGNPEFARLWQLADESNGGRFGRYQARTERPIPVVVLTPHG